MIDRCPSPEELLDAAIGRPNVRETSALARHIESCEACSRRVREMRALSGAIHSLPAAHSTECLTDEEIALLAEGSAVHHDERLMLHSAQCAECRSRVAAVAQLMDDPSVGLELRALADETPQVRRGPRRYVAYAGLAAAAVAAIVLLGPAQERSNRDGDAATTEQHREPQTDATLPRVVSPTATAVPGDSLRWTAVPEADLYRVRIWDAEGTVVWTVETKSMTVELPAQLESGVQYMWDVSARTGWDRWVSSDLAALTIRGR